MLCTLSGELLKIRVHSLFTSAIHSLRLVRTNARIVAIRSYKTLVFQVRVGHFVEVDDIY